MPRRMAITPADLLNHCVLPFFSGVRGEASAGADRPRQRVVFVPFFQRLSLSMYPWLTFTQSRNPSRIACYKAHAPEVFMPRGWLRYVVRLRRREWRVTAKLRFERSGQNGPGPLV
jgi:hypothetical protein